MRLKNFQSWKSLIHETSYAAYREVLARRFFVVPARRFFAVLTPCTDSSSPLSKNRHHVDTTRDIHSSLQETAVTRSTCHKWPIRALTLTNRKPVCLPVTVHWLVPHTAGWENPGGQGEMSWWPVLCYVVVGSNQYQKSRRLYVNYGHPQIGSDHTPDSLSAWGNYSIKESNKGSTCGWFAVIFSVAFRMNPQISSVTPQMLGYLLAV